MSLRRILLFSLFVAYTLAAQSARADEGDVIHFASPIHVSAGSSIHDAVCFFCSIRVEGKVTGDIVAIFGSVDLKGDAQHDVVNIFGNVLAQKDSSVDNDLISIFGNVRLGENVVVTDDLLVIFGALHAPDSVMVGGDRMEQPLWLVLLPLLILVLSIAFVVHNFRAYRRRLATRNFPPASRH